MVLERAQQLLSQLRGSGLAQHEKKRPDDVVVTMAIRTPLTKARKGGLKECVPRYLGSDSSSMRLDELMTATFRAAISKMNIEPALVEDIVVGNVLSSKGAYEARGAALLAGFPDTTCSFTLNRFCSSGLMACQAVANQIRAGEIKVGLAVGIESMSFTPDRGLGDISDEMAAHPVAKDVVMPMGWTSENVGRRRSSALTRAGRW